MLAQIRSLSAQAGAGVKPSAASGRGPPPAAPARPAGSTAFGATAQAGHRLGQHRQQQTASALADAWERGTPGVDLAQVMIESQKASVSFRALTEVRNRLVSAYQDIMNMSI